MMQFDDYSLFTIKAHRLLRAIQEQANAREYEKASDTAYALKELSLMLYESLANCALQEGLKVRD
jgi:hypothetical protein